VRNQLYQVDVVSFRELSPPAYTQETEMPRESWRKVLYQLLTAVPGVDISLHYHHLTGERLVHTPVSWRDLSNTGESVTHKTQT
jgi:hypothetical protein